jgi:hypothetical protein
MFIRIKSALEDQARWVNVDQILWLRDVPGITGGIDNPTQVTLLNGTVLWSEESVHALIHDDSEVR